MLDFLNKKVPLTHLFTKEYVDIHSHLLPGIDDGAKTMEDAVQMILKLRSYGIEKFITTPHISEGYPNTENLILQKLEELHLELDRRSISNVSIRAAAEYKFDDLFDRLLKEKNLMTLKQDYVLVELGFFDAPINLYNTLFDMQLAGFKPVLAHPERYLFYEQRYDEFSRLKRAGCTFQLDLLSLVGYYGETSKRLALRLLKDQLIDYVGTDAHHDYHLELMQKLGSKKWINKLESLISNNSRFY